MAECEPLEESSSLMSEPRRKFWDSPWHNSSLGQIRVALFHHVMLMTPRPTDPANCIAHGYVNNMKLHDREPELLVAAMEAIDPHFFDGYPRLDKSKPMSSREKRAAIGEAARSFYRHGIAAYGKENLRKSEGRTPIGVI